MPPTPATLRLPSRRKRTFASISTVAATVAATLLVAAPASAADVTFADPGLQSCVNQSLGHPANTPVSTGQAASITQLSCSGMGITSLGGIQALTSMWDLTLANNTISDLSPLTGLTKITQINIANNQVSNLGPFATLPNLVYISAGGNSYSDLTPLAGLTQTLSLDISRNNVSNLGPLSSLSKLEGLVMNSNQISDLTPISGLTRMAGLYADNNQIVDLAPLSGLTRIFQLFLKNNEIRDLGPLASITSLDNVHLQDNHITDLSPLGDMPVLAQVHAYDQTLTLPAVTVGQSTQNPLREPHGATHALITGDSGFALGADGSSWTYTAAAANSLSWNMAYPGPVWPAWEFSGTITQRSDARIVVVNPTTLVDDTASTKTAQAVTIDVLANDGLSGEPLLNADSLTLIDESGNPTTQLTRTEGVFTVTDGAIVFTPATGFSGVVAPVSYVVTNAEGVEGRAAIRVTVTAVVIPTTPPTTAPMPSTVTPASESGNLALTGGGVALPWLAGGALLVLLGAAASVIGWARRRQD